MSQLRIAMICGSVRMGRKTIRAVKFLERVIKESDHPIELDILDLEEFDFPVMYERLRYHPNPPDRLQEFSDRLKAADGLIFASPEYNGGFSPALKNTTDYFYVEYNKKPIGLMTVSSGRWGGVNASHDLQKLILNLDAFPMPWKIMIPHVGDTIDEEGHTEADWLIKSANKFLDNLVWFVGAIKDRKEKES